MDVQTVVANVLTFNTNTFVRPALQGFSDADLLKRPSEACNPIGWLFWHQPRVEDLILSHISGRPQTWVAYTWHAQFGRPADPRDSGFGHPSSRSWRSSPLLRRSKAMPLGCRGQRSSAMRWIAYSRIMSAEARAYAHRTLFHIDNVIKLSRCSDVPSRYS
jgi:hypothetical protein